MKMSAVNLYKTIEELPSAVGSAAELKDGKLKIADQDKFRKLAYALVYNSIFNPNQKIQELCRWFIRSGADACGIQPASIHDLYMARGRGECGGFTVPAINIRGLTFDVALMVFKAAMANKAGPVIFEIARSEIGYTQQRPVEYATAVLGAALAAGYSGPVFIQGDHYQVNAKKYKGAPEGEINYLRGLIIESIDAGFYNIDIDASTLVDLSKPTEEVQQETNAALTHDFTLFIREKQPKGVTVSVGGEIGEVGSQNSTVGDLKGFMNNYNKKLQASGGAVGISKISVQTGTTHGGVPLPDGTIAKVKVDFDTLETLSRVARDEYGMAGAVQHGASTLPEEAFHLFRQKETAEIHLATGFQNMIYDNPSFPADLKRAIYEHIRKEHSDEKKQGETEEQFIYKTRKKAFGPFKKQVWDLPDDIKGHIGKALEKQFDFLFKQLGVPNTETLVKKYIKPATVQIPAPSAITG
jgi:fructose/tagatose bisphosphate aldolase